MATATLDETAPTRLQRPGGWWTSLGTALVVAAFALWAGGFGPAWRGLRQFFALQAERPANLAYLQEGFFGTLAAMVVISLAGGYASAWVTRAICGKPNVPPKFFEGVERLPRFKGFMIIILAEELFTRALFLGLIGQFWTGRVAAYVLFLVGNSLWALMHLSNYRDPKDRHIARVLPQFVGGIPLTVVFLHYGFFAALLVHVAYDMILFAEDKLNKFNAGEIKSIGVNVVLLVAGLLFVGKPLSDLTQWAKFDGMFAIPGWGFWNYFWAVVVVSSALTIVGDLFLFDYDAAEKVQDVSLRVSTSIVLVLLMIGGYWALGPLAPNGLDRLLTLTIGLLFLHPSISGSNVARTFWISIPSTMPLLCGTFALHGFWAKVIFVFAMSIINIPEEICRVNDER